VRHMHVGGEKLFELLRPLFYWPTLLKDCYAFPKGCFECQLTAGRATGSWAGKLLDLPPGPRCVWALDCMDRLGHPDAPTAHVLTMVDCFSKFVLLALLPDKKAATITDAVHTRLVTVFGAPAAVRCDNGTEFKGDFAAYCAARHIRMHRTSPYTSHSNGQAERLHHVVQQLMRRTLVTLPPAAWPTLLPDVQFAINCTYAKSIGCPPYLVMFGTTPPAQAYASLPDPSTASLSSYTAALKRQLTTIQAAAHAAHHAYQRRTAAPTTLPADTLALRPGQLAMVTRPRSHKLFTRNAGPFLVSRVETPHVYLQSLTHGTVIKEHCKNVRPFLIEI
jgi:transposase InsO family protein